MVSAVCDESGVLKGLPRNKTVPLYNGPVILFRMMNRKDRVIDLELESAIEAVTQACRARRIDPPSRSEWSFQSE